MWNAISIYSFYSNGHVHVYTILKSVLTPCDCVR